MTLRLTSTLLCLALFACAKSDPVSATRGAPSRAMTHGDAGVTFDAAGDSTIASADASETERTATSEAARSDAGAETPSAAQPGTAGRAGSSAPGFAGQPSASEEAAGHNSLPMDAGNAAQQDSASAAGGGAGHAAASDAGNEARDADAATRSDAAVQVIDAATVVDAAVSSVPDAGPAASDASAPQADAAQQPSDASTADAQAADSGIVDPPGRDAGLCASCGGCEEIKPVTSAFHTTDPIVYPDPPPVGGPHNPCWARWMVHDKPMPEERWVHNLEHGGVVLLYNCPEGCAADVAKLASFVKAHQRTLLTADARMPKRFAIVSWGHRLVSDCVDDAALARFYAANFDHGSESEDAQPDPKCDR